MAPARRSHVVVSTLILALLACVEIACGWTMCDTAKCGRGRCSEVQGPITTYKCTCDPGWSQPSLLNLTLDFAPCIIPHCTFDSSCYNVSLLPKAIPLPPDIDPCVAVNCGPGECKRGEGLSYSCKCQDGYVNFLNSTSFPCVKNCVFGMDCSKLGIGPPSPPPPPSTAPLPPPGNHDSPAPPNGPKGSASSRQLLLLLLLSFAMVHQLV